MAQLQKHKNKAGMSLHHFIATGGKPANFNSVNKKKKKNGK